MQRSRANAPPRTVYRKGLTLLGKAAGSTEGSRDSSLRNCRPTAGSQAPRSKQRAGTDRVRAREEEEERHKGQTERTAIPSGRRAQGRSRLGQPRRQPDGLEPRGRAKPADGRGCGQGSCSIGR